MEGGKSVYQARDKDIFHKRFVVSVRSKWHHG
jgi:hypothetical protein